MAISKQDQWFKVNGSRIQRQGARSVRSKPPARTGRCHWRASALSVVGTIRVVKRNPHGEIEGVIRRLATFSISAARGEAVRRLFEKQMVAAGGFEQQTISASDRRSDDWAISRRVALVDRLR